jgi:hypothetical protein
MPLFSSNPEAISALYHHLPPDLPGPPSPETLQRVIRSAQPTLYFQVTDCSLCKLVPRNSEGQYPVLTKDFALGF